ncbi:plasmid stabilization protein [Saccharopolyspora sp. ID03-671]|uniref:plasmid stabilization protein n=1 Tax=Saccharopolyspora sp. ID03-671 TaxID=3073066 RepID=UPI003247C3A1
MPQRAWSAKEERQYEHVKQGAKEHGSGEGRAEEIAARTVNKNRAQKGTARQRSKVSTEDIPPQRRGGKRSGNREGPGGRTKRQLYEDAKREGIEGRSKMSKEELERALARR